MNISVNLRVWVTLVSIFAIVLTAGYVMEMVSHTNKSDSGVTACQGIADKAAHPTPKASSTKNNPMTEDQYKKNLEPYENSKYADIKVAGINVINTVYDMSRDTGADYSTNMANLYTLRDHWAALQRACSNHGVTIPGIA